MLEGDKKTVDIPNGSRQTQQPPAKQIRQGNVSRALRALTTRIYTEQLAPLYPPLSKTQVRAALVLAQNNLHECRLILDMKCKFVELKNSLNPPRLRRKTPADNESSDSSDSLDARTKGLKIIKKKREDIERCEGVMTIETNKKYENVEKSEVISSSLTSTTFSSMRSSASSVYDFSDSESSIESPMEWFEKKRNKANGSGLSNKKVGVIIIKSQSGYRACLL